MTSITVETEVDIEDYLDVLPTQVLVDELTSRGLRPDSAALREDCADLLNDIRAAAKSGDMPHLECLLLRIEQVAGVPRDFFSPDLRRQQADLLLSQHARH